MTFHRIVPLALTALVLAACATRAITPRDPIPVPDRLSSAEVEQAVEQAIRQTHHRYRWEEAKFIVEDKSAGRFVVAVHYRGKYAQYAVAHGPEAVSTALLGSKNFKQSATRVHRNVLDFQDLLEDNIARELARAAAAP